VDGGDPLPAALGWRRLSAPIERHTLTVPRTARFHVLGNAAAPCREAWFLLHGYGQLAAPFLESFGAWASPERVLVAPEALSRFYLRRGTGAIGASWMTREERADEIADTLRYLDLVAERVLAGRQMPVHVLGFSQGAAAAARWAALGRTALARVVLWGAALPPDLAPAQQAERLRRARWTLVAGERDEAVDRAGLERERERLGRAGIACELVAFPGGHELDAATLERLLSSPGR
jgi:predicted esterase